MLLGKLEDIFSSWKLFLLAGLFQITHDSARRKHAVIGGRANAESAPCVESAPELVGDGPLTAGIETRNGLKIAVDESTEIDLIS